MSETYNVDLLMQVREKIETEPRRHDQAMWATATDNPAAGGDCGTAYCVAGWAAALDGQTFWWRENEEMGGWWATHLENGESIDRYARHALGLSGQESDRLFSSVNSRANVLARLDRLIEAGKNGEHILDGEL